MTKFISKCFLLFVLIYVIQFFISQKNPMIVPEEISKMETSLNAKKDIFYFGDSILFTNGSIPNLLESKLPKTSVGMVAHPSDSPPVFLEYCHYLSRTNDTPKAIIIPISLRDYSPDWELDPLRQFTEEQLHFRYAKTPVYPFLPFLISFNVFPLYHITPASFNTSHFLYKGKDLGTIGSYHTQAFETYTDEHMRKKIQISYVFELREDDKALHALTSLIDACNFTKIIYYFTPLSFKTGEHFVGKEFTTQVETNIATIKQALDENHATYLDMSHDLPEKVFDWDLGLYMGDHLQPEGQEYVATKLADFIQKNHKLSPN